MNSGRCPLLYGYCVLVPFVAMRPIVRPLFSVNQRAPSGPLMIESGSLY